MAIKSIRLENFRNLTAVELTPCLNGLNVIHGDNGSGKTSVLEAIYYIALGRSFRTSTASRLIQHLADKFLIFAQVIGEAERMVPVGVERDVRGTVRLKMGEKDVSSTAEMASFLPIRMINTHSQHLFESGPVFRRKYLDWGLFYQDEGFLTCWRQFERILKQRNAALRERRTLREISVWTDELAQSGQELTHFRRQYVDKLTPYIREVAKELLDVDDLQISYFQGWNESEEYGSILTQSIPDECRLGHTQFGPHRADLDVKIDAISVKHFLSRGQQKLLVCAMIIAQGIMLSKAANKGLIYLVDDLAAELDKQSRDKLISLLSRQNAQVFITAIEKKIICDLAITQPDVSMRVFHVEHGGVVESI